MSKTPLEEFEEACRAYFQKTSLGDLRVYGRKLGVKEPTKKNKDELIDYIINVLTGAITPIERSHRGAPVKNEHFDPEIEEKLEELRIRYLSDYKPKLLIPNTVFTFESPIKAELDKDNIYTQEVYCGQLEKFSEIYRLLPLSRIFEGKTLIIPAETVEKYGLREGDVVSCTIDKDKNLARTVLTVNGWMVEEYKRGNFDETPACYPYEPIRVFEPNRFDGATNKYIQWLNPLGKGQRGCIVSAPKAGKTVLLREILKSANDLNSNLSVLALLVGESPENVNAFSKTIDKDNFIYTTYEDDSEKQVFCADFILKRAKRMAESGKNVLLIVDSFNALARAYNDSDASSGGKMLNCGLESKTVQYLKKYLASGRCFENGGSLTVLGALSEGTGNPADDYLSTELKMISNFEINLDVALCSKGVFPAIVNGNSSLEKTYLPAFTEKEIKALQVSATKSEFFSRINTL